jgi:preprotein translocase subunit YajC
LTAVSQLSGWLPVLLAQAGDAAGKAAAKTGDAAGKAADGQGGGIFDALFATPMFPVMLTLMLLYFLFMRPDSRKKKDAEAALANLKINDHVVTIGGICGVVVNLSSESSTVTIRVDDKSGTKLKVLKSAISRIGSPDEAADQAAKEAK